MDLSALMGNHLKLRHLALVLAIEDHGSLIRTAEALYLTQPALSRSLREIEQTMGTPLFDRSPTGMRPTAAGFAVLEHARAVIGHIETMERRVTELNDPGAGLVRVGAHVTGANSLVPRATGKLLEARPAMRVTIREAPPDVLIEELLRGEIDVLVGRMTSHESTADLDLVPLYHEPFRVAVGTHHPFLNESEIKLSTLQPQNWVTPVRGTPLRDSWERAFLTAGLALPTVQVECGTPMPAKVLARDFGFLAVLPESLIVEDPDLASLPMRFPQMTDLVGLMLAPGRQATAAASLLIEALRDEASVLDARLRS